jgi:hypothetical protein
LEDLEINQQAAISCVFLHIFLGGPPLDEDMWHVTEYYANIRNKVKNLGKDLGDCHKIEGSLPARMCNIPMKVRNKENSRVQTASI